VLDIPVPEIILERACIDALIRQRVTASMAQLMRMHPVSEPGRLAKRSIIVRKPRVVNGAPRSETNL
jgi:hypothetical protein